MNTIKSSTRNTFKAVTALLLGMSLAACGGAGGDSASAPTAPTTVKAVAGATVGTTAKVSFTAPASDGGSAITGYTVTATPGGITATGTASPITLTGLTAGTVYTFAVVANNGAGKSAAATASNVANYNIVETFHEPMTQPNDTIFTGTFTYDSVNKTVSNLMGALSESMTKVNGVYAAPMTTVHLMNQLSSVPVTLGGVDGLLVTTFALATTDTFDLGGFAPGGTQYFGLTAGTPNNHNAYAMVFVNTTDPTATSAQAQIDKLAYADCTAGGMMMSSCMTGTTMAGYGSMGTMMGEPVSQVITKQ
jgi:hypothetical protein